MGIIARVNQIVSLRWLGGFGLGERELRTALERETRDDVRRTAERRLAAIELPQEF